MTTGCGILLFMVVDEDVIVEAESYRNYRDQACDCSAMQSAVCLAAAPVFLLGATRHFVLLSRSVQKS